VNAILPGPTETNIAMSRNFDLDGIGTLGPVLGVVGALTGGRLAADTNGVGDPVFGLRRRQLRQWSLGSSRRGLVSRLSDRDRVNDAGSRKVNAPISSRL